MDANSSFWFLFPRSRRYVSSRALYSMAITGSAPKIFARTNSWGLPWMALIVAVAFSLLSYMTAGATTAGNVRFCNLTPEL